MTGTAAENYAGVALESLNSGWDKSKDLADVRDARARQKAKISRRLRRNITITEDQLSEFPIIIVNLTAPRPERKTMARVARVFKMRWKAWMPWLEAGLAGDREEMHRGADRPLRRRL